MAAVIYRCPVSPDCPPAEQGGFCPTHPTDRLEPDRGSAFQAQTEPSTQASPAHVPPPTQLRQTRRQPASPGDLRHVLALQVAGERVEIPEEGLVIGREIPRFRALPDAVSRHHAQLFWQGDELCVVDLGSLNGTYVDGGRIKTIRPLRAGQVLGLSLDCEIPIVGGEFDDYGLPPI